MDDEGFPLLSPGAMLQPSEDRADSIDQESGEATGRRVVVLRKTQPNTRPSWAEYSFARSRLLHGSLHRRREAQRIPSIPRSITLHHELPRVPPLWTQELPCPDCLCVPPRINPEGADLRKAVSKVPFRVPQAHPKAKPKEKEVTISIWREFCRGPLVYEDANSSWNDVKDTCLLWPHLQALFGSNDLMVPLFCVCLVRLVLLMLKVFVPWIGLQLSYFHLLYVHIKIHMTGEKRGVQPVFVGPASQGPIIYSIRHLWCPYCRYNKQCKIYSSYFDKLLRERQSMATT
ncbi:uncharacterized protein LOC123516167 [Portunus trituberculatus]|uniref:Uncharacterized protein n=1 Tax=Portunus trituberculatus TaxID=210409 RepID=A0A5B7F3J5_PORTR|nr:uncharacterized protein LOC123516167 [Portunus trituberculatus]XP_045131266.1 uncharacterized protein LOC123516167 [Portunus trituberculatus]XP_045131267.1 uncharacterized protein LOC123516167 [Portunus trituberculatus]MPC39184.1 hypothetical protein [Portunus trituberculatus]